MKDGRFLECKLAGTRLKALGGLGFMFKGSKRRYLYSSPRKLRLLLGLLVWMSLRKDSLFFFSRV